MKEEETKEDQKTSKQAPLVKAMVGTELLPVPPVWGHIAYGGAL